MLKRYKAILNIEAPVGSIAAVIPRDGIDQVIATDAWGRPLLPGTLVTGHLREQLVRAASKMDNAEAVAPVKNALGMLGAPGFDAQDGGERARLHVTDFVARRRGDPDRTATRIAIDAVDGNARTGAVVVTEERYAPGESVLFVGELAALFYPDEDEAAVVKAVQLSLASVLALGADVGIGSGRIMGVSIEPIIPAPCRTTDHDRSNLDVVLQLREPFLFAHRRIGDNAFAGTSEIPGGAIKAAIARQILAAQPDRTVRFVADLEDGESPLVECFDSLHVSHFRPCRAESGMQAGILDGDDALRVPLAPCTPPLHFPRSLARVGDGFVDLALVDGPVLVDGSVPRFFPDWKARDIEQAQQLFDWSEPGRTLRMHVEIDPSRRAAKGEVLFSESLVDPSNHVWLGRFSLDPGGCDPERAPEIWTALRELLRQGLGGLGRTNAIVVGADIDLDQDMKPPLLVEIDGKAVAILTLQSPALLRPIESRAESGPDLTAAYRRAFRELSGGQLHLRRCFVSERMVGGQFIARRYGRNPYRPWVATEPGSVFVLEAKNNEAENTLSGWAQFGLPMPASVKEALGADPADSTVEEWRICHMVRSNGYGEVRVNMPAHLQLRPLDLTTKVKYVA